MANDVPCFSELEELDETELFIIEDALKILTETCAFCELDYDYEKGDADYTTDMVFAVLEKIKKKRFVQKENNTVAKQ